MKIVYTSSERFMNEMINCIKRDRMQMFHRHYRSADVLLIDDIQILGGKERTQEEFFHTFNELFEHQKQIVISSDSPPKQHFRSGGAPALPFRMGFDGGCSAARSRNQDGHSRQESRAWTASSCRKTSASSSPPRPSRMCGNWKARWSS